MSAAPTALNELSNALAARVESAGGLAVAVRNDRGQHVSGLLWTPDAVVASEQCFGARPEYEIVNANGETTKAQIIGRDPGTNLLVLRPRETLEAASIRAGAATVGALAIAVGVGADGGRTARLGVVHAVGPQWHSRAGGRIEQRIGLDIRLSRTEEGGPVVDADGALLGMSTFGPSGEVLVIPHATIERVAPQLLRDGRVARGWLGLALQPVAAPEPMREAAGSAIGLLVLSVDAEGPGARAGVIPSDILVAVGGASLRSARQLTAHLHEDCIGKAVELRLIRGGQIVSLQATVEPRPQLREY
jgi:S1-C subfamily serine protease